MTDMKTPADVDRLFQGTARSVLDEKNLTALEWVEQSPGANPVELAKRLQARANAAGLIPLIYLEAAETGKIRMIAKELLLREILARFPDGWFHDDDVRASVKLGGWVSHLRRHSEHHGVLARNVLRELVIDHSPPEGWRPASLDDERLTQVFDKCWPEVTGPS